MVGTQHANSRSKFGSPERNHVLSNMGSHHLTMLRRSVVKNPLNKVISVLVTGNVNQWDAGAIAAPLTNSVKISAEKLSIPNFEALLHYLGGKLVGAIFCSIPNNVIDGSAAVRRGPMFAYMLDAPVSKLAVSHNVNVGEDFFDTRTLLITHQSPQTPLEVNFDLLCHPPDSSQKCSEQRDCQSLPVQLRATFPSKTR